MHFENVKCAELKTWIRNKKGRRGGRREREREKKERKSIDSIKLHRFNDIYLMMSLQELFLIDITVFVNQLHSAIEARNLMLEKEKLMEIYMCLCARVRAYVSVCLSVNCIPYI